MKFGDLLVATIRQSEIPLRFEPGAEEAITEPIRDFLKVWLEAHTPAKASTDYDYGRKHLVEELVSEVEGSRNLPE
jgi:hypothetical protein